MTHIQLKSILSNLLENRECLILRASILSLFCFLLITSVALAHNVTPGDAGYVQEIWGVNLIPFAYLGAKHMVTGYDHILFLLGVIFFLYRTKDVAIYVSLFAAGHSITMLAGVLMQWGINAYIVDAIIGLSIVYKALDNLGAYQKWLGFQPSTKIATFVFGLFHGTGLASKLLDYKISEDGLLENLIAFNVGVEIGQLLALGGILIIMGYWRRHPAFSRHASFANLLLMFAGFGFIWLHMSGYIAALS